MQHARRLLRWLLFVGCFMAIGVGVFHFVRYSPRCVIEGPIGYPVLSPDGARLLTVALDEIRVANDGPLRVWDAHTGALIMERFAGAKGIAVYPARGSAISVINNVNGSVVFLNWQVDDDEWEQQNTEKLQVWPMDSSGRWFAGTNDEAGTTVIFDRVRRDTLPLAGGWEMPKVLERERLIIDRRKGTNQIILYDPEKRQVVDSFNIASSNSLCQVCPLGQSLLETDAWLEKDDPEWMENYQIRVWDIKTHERRVHFELPRPGVLNTWFSRDGRYVTANTMSVPENERRAVVVEVSTGLSRYKLEGWTTVYLAPDASTFTVHHGVWTVFDAPTGRVLWEAGKMVPMYVDSAFMLQFSAPTRPSIPAVFVDARTGMTVGPSIDELDLNTPGNYSGFMHTDDAKHFLVHGRWRERERGWLEMQLEKYFPRVFVSSQAGAVVLESETLNVLFRVGSPSDRFLLSDDASTLASIEGTDIGNSIRIYDVHPGRAWRWAIGVALGSAIVWQFGVLSAFRIVKRRRLAAKAQPPVGTSGR